MRFLPLPLAAFSRLMKSLDLLESNCLTYEERLVESSSVTAEERGEVVKLSSDPVSVSPVGVVGTVLLVESSSVASVDSSGEEHAAKRNSCSRKDSEKRAERVCFRTLLGGKKDDGIIPPLL